VVIGLVSLAGVIVAGTIGYVVLDLGLLDAVYQTVITVFSVGFSERGEVTPSYQVFTVAVVLLGNGTVLFTLTMVIDALVEGRLSDEMRRRRMQQRLDTLHDHVVVCGLGQVGAALVDELRSEGRTVVAVDRSAEVLHQAGPYALVGDATSDEVLVSAGIRRAATLVCALDTDAANLYVTLSARALNAGLFIVARANEAAAEPKLRQAGADRVVNPHRMSGTRMAALVTQPHVADFLDVVMHDRDLEVRLAEVVVADNSPFVGRTLGQCEVRESTGATVVAIRRGHGPFDPNPGTATVLQGGDVLIALGTAEQLQRLRDLPGSWPSGPGRNVSS
jgi:voltage-gated potassium channel